MAEIAAARTGTGGPQDSKKIVEHIAGWALCIVLAMLVTQLHML
ncbi:SCO1431 family membrane protein [Streptomyces sp. H39-S7]|nr:SCO1431 family membrane protein [Streptomyces sp. H39-S7]MCZ4120718.1 SCO1431 family membrane protein [Streptomyces sp. H39-S7]